MTKPILLIVVSITATFLPGQEIDLKTLNAQVKAAMAGYDGSGSKPHPLTPYVDKYFEIAARHSGEELGAKALTSCLYYAGLDATFKKHVHRAVEGIVTRHADSKAAEKLGAYLRMVDARALSIAERIPYLRRLHAATKSETVKAASLYHVARCTRSTSGGDPKRAIELYRQLLADHPKSAFAKKARAEIFELTSLRVGMQAPDFEATDIEGRSFKLSDYRGKVVVLDFWGFW